MDDATLGLIGGIVGCVIGVGGGLFGTYCSIRRAKTPAARKLVVQMSLYIWALILTLLASQLVLPFPDRGLVWLPYGLGLALLIRWSNRQEASIDSDPEVVQDQPDETHE